MNKKIYQKPQLEIIVLSAMPIMLSGSDTVKNLNSNPEEIDWNNEGIEITEPDR